MGFSAALRSLFAACCVAIPGMTAVSIQFLTSTEE
jgi:hypothetical protein